MKCSSTGQKLKCDTILINGRYVEYATNKGISPSDIIYVRAINQYGISDEAKNVVNKPSDKSVRGGHC
ncbi:MAG: hypothetical protein ACTHK8_12970 [Ginsengibacter sp.]